MWCDSHCHVPYQGLGPEVIGQAAAERLGVPIEKVAVFIGDSDLPPAPVAGGSNSTASTCSAVIKVCE